MHARTRSALPFTVAFALVAVTVATPVRAQQAALAPAAIAAPSLVPSAPTAPAPVAAPAAGPTLDAATVAVQRRDDVAPLPQPRRGGSAPGMALMIVGGAAILVGIVVGDDAGHAISIGGAIIGLVGLYQYLQ